MTALLRPCSIELANALAEGVPLWIADIYAVTLADGASTFYWTSWDRDLLVGDQLYLSKAPWISRSKWNVTNTMQVPTLTVTLSSLSTNFNGGLSLIAQILAGWLDGASILLSRAYMTTPGNTAALGTIELFGGVTGAIDIDDITAAITAKGKVNILDQYIPRNLYQTGCNHAFCDPGCKLNRATYTTTATVGAAPEPILIAWPGAVPRNASNYTNGTLVVTSGLGASQRRTIQQGSSAGLLLAYPLTTVPNAGDAISIFEGCDKTAHSGSGQSCSDRANLQNYRGFEFVPPPDSAY